MKSSEPLLRVGTALADPLRQTILLALLDGPMYSSELAEQTGASRSNMSNHLACLRGCGLVTATAMSRRVQYRLVSDALAHALRDLLTLEQSICANHQPTAAAKTIKAVTPSPTGQRSKRR